MKILVIHNNFGATGGEEYYISCLISLLKKNGHSVLPYIKDSRSISSKLLTRIQQGFNAFQGTTVRDELTKLIRKYKPDIAHIGNMYPLITPVVVDICKSFRIPIVHSILDHRLVCPKGTLFRKGAACTLCVGKALPIYSLLYSCYHNSFVATSLLVSTELKYRAQNYIHSIDHFLFSSHYSQDLIVQNSSISKVNTTLVPYFAWKRHVLPESPYPFPYFVFVGRLSPEKGIMHLLQLFEKLPHIHLVVVGTGPLRKQVDFYRQFDNIHIAGYLSEEAKLTVIRHARATLIPSSPLYEVGPYTLIESYSLGTPAVVPKAGVFLERMTERESGYFFKPDDFVDLRKQIVEVSMLSENARAALRKGSKKKYLKTHTPEKFYQTLMKVYKNLQIKSASFRL